LSGWTGGTQLLLWKVVVVVVGVILLVRGCRERLRDSWCVREGPGIPNFIGSEFLNRRVVPVIRADQRLFSVLRFNQTIFSGARFVYFGQSTSALLNQFVRAERAAEKNSFLPRHLAPQQTRTANPALEAVLRGVPVGIPKGHPLVLRTDIGLTAATNLAMLILPASETVGL